MTLLLLHAAFTWAMAGVIWFVQIAHYPLFIHIDKASFATYESINTSRTTWIVAPLMIAELICAIALWMSKPENIPNLWLLAGLGLLVIIWFSTAVFSVPQHALLSTGFDERAWSKLVTMNWIRTLSWSARAALALWMIHLASRS